MTPLPRGLRWVPTPLAEVSPDDARGTWEALPSGYHREKRFLFTLRDHAGRSLGLLDLVRDFPESGTAFLGWLQIREENEGRGLGSQAYALAEALVRDGGCRRIRLGVVGSSPVEGFWRRQGFVRTGETMVPHDGSVHAVIRVLQKDTVDPASWRLCSLGTRTDLLFPALEGVLTDRGHYAVVQTPGNRFYMNGNQLLFRAPPKAGEAAEWVRASRAELRDGPVFMTFGWDEPLGADDTGIAEFLAQNFRLDESVVLSLSGLPLRPAFWNPEIVTRPLVDDRDWGVALQSHLDHLCAGPVRDTQSDFARYQFRRFRDLSERGHGLWFGAFLGESMVGNMGVFWDAHYARFQEVFTDPGHRRRAVCRTMCAHAIAHVRARIGERVFVTVADDGGEAVSSYVALGFGRVGRQRSLRWYSGRGL